MPPASIPPDAPQAICAALGATLGATLGSGASKQTFQITLAGKVTVALKVLDNVFPRERLEREIDAMRACDHPSIARVYDFGRVKVSGTQVAYILEEYLDGGTLGQRLATFGPLPPQETRSILLSLSEALAHLHQRRLVHRDIKPDNIMFKSASTDPVLVDFGIVRFLGENSLTQTFHSMGPGTPYYAAPEQLRNEKYQIDWRTDQFSLGIVGSMCTLASHPYSLTGDTEIQTIERVIQRQGPRLQFSTEAKQAQLAPIATMVQPWSIRRFRLPEELIDAWQP
jgi:serine/threonine protein kinase